MDSYENISAGKTSSGDSFKLLKGNFNIWWLKITFSGQQGTPSNAMSQCCDCAWKGRKKLTNRDRYQTRCFVCMNKTILSTALTILLIRWVCQFSGELELFCSIFGGVCTLRRGCAKNEGICCLFAVALDLVPCPGLLLSLRWDLCLGSAGTAAP